MSRRAGEGRNMTWREKSQKETQLVSPVATKRERVPQEELQRKANELLSQGASGEEFEKLHRLGWRPPSQQQSDGLQACPSDCGVCHPTPSLRQVR